ncbi:endoplasmic Reticulum Oxidoreductin 1 [Trichuris suis]|nr:endoplasmic Reticulum Oxidoreductin 1 [Trichuris suis]
MGAKLEDYRFAPNFVSQLLSIYHTFTLCAMGQMILFVVALLSLKLASSELFQSGDPCFCHSLGELHSCECTEKSVDVFNNVHIHGLLAKLLKKDCFRYYKTDMEKDCPFWQSNRYCTSRECGIENCDDEVPIALKYTKYQAPDAYRSSRCDESNEIDPLDKTITAGQRKKLEKWTEHDERLDVYCDVEDESSEKLHYVDLIRNPERYTGYKGNSAQRVWKCIYEENCFKPDPKFDKEYLIYPNIRGKYCSIASACKSPTTKEVKATVCSSFKEFPRLNSAYDRLKDDFNGRLQG